MGKSHLPPRSAAHLAGRIREAGRAADEARWSKGATITSGEFVDGGVDVTPPVAMLTLVTDDGEQVGRVVDDPYRLWQMSNFITTPCHVAR